MNPRFIRDYEDELYKFVKKEEEFRPKVYACSQHVPTIGVGYALAEETGGVFRPRAGLEDDVGKIGTTLTMGDKNRLSRVCDMLNEGTIMQAITGSKFKDPFDLVINEEQASQLFLLCIPRYDADLRRKLGLKLYKQFQNTKEMVSLFSLDYNAPGLIGKGLVSALREGNRAKVQYEILYGSNRNRDIGLDNRRKREAKEFGQYDGENPTAEELNAEKEVETAHRAQIVAYAGEMAAKRKPKSAKKASGTKTALNKNRNRQQPGTVPNQKVVRKRIDEVKAHPRHQRHTILEMILERFETHDKVTYREWSNHPAGLDAQHYHKRWS